MDGITASFHSAVIPWGSHQSHSKPALRIFVFILSLSKQALNGHYENKNPSPFGEGFAVALRRKRDSNPRIRGNRSTVFKTAAFDRSAISPPQR
jgi:hypothetical protein